MNKLQNASNSNRQTASAIKNLRASQNVAKPLHVTIFTGITNSAILAPALPPSKISDCGNAPISRQSKADQRFMINEAGRWTKVSIDESNPKSKRPSLTPILLTVSQLIIVAILAWQMQTEEFRADHRTVMKNALVKMQEQLKFELPALNNFVKAETAKKH